MYNRRTFGSDQPPALLHLFEDISKRDELAGIGFDRRAAAASLRLYLGE